MLAVLAQMMDRGDHGDMAGWGWWWLVVLLVLVALVVVVVVLVARPAPPPPPGAAAPPAPHRAGAEEILAERLARGEIDEDEYRRRRDALRG